MAYLSPEAGLQAVNDLLADVEGMSLVKEGPQEKLSSFPICFAYINQLTWLTRASMAQLMGPPTYVIRIETHVKRLKMPDDYYKLLPLASNINRKLNELNNVDGMSALSMSVTIAPQSFGDQVTLAWMCDVTIQGY